DDQNFFIARLDATFKESAAFANLTYKFNDRFDVSGGERYSHYTKTTGCEVASGVFGTGTTPCQFPPATNVSTWMGNARYHFGRNAMIYARIATGYRPGATNAAFAVVSAEGRIPLEVDPDRTTNYELGYKAELLDHRLQLSTSLFHIAWSDIQAQI